MSKIIRNFENNEYKKVKNCFIIKSTTLNRKLLNEPDQKMQFVVTKESSAESFDRFMKKYDKAYKLLSYK